LDDNFLQLNYKNNQKKMAQPHHQGHRDSIFKQSMDKLFIWSWNAPVPDGVDPNTYVKETNHKEVKEWLDSQNLGQYAETFKKNNISGAEVPFLGDEHFKQMGIIKVGHRIQLSKACKNFKRTLNNWERNEVIMEFINWHVRPRACVLFPTKYRLTPAAIVVYNPEPCVLLIFEALLRCKLTFFNPQTECNAVMKWISLMLPQLLMLI
jgi:hypothetical protein